MATVHCRPSHVWILLLTPPVRSAFWRTSHTHKNPNNGVLTKEYGYHKCSVPKNEQHINKGDMRLSQPLHVKVSRVTRKATAIQLQKMQIGWNHQKKMAIGILSLAYDQEVHFEFYILHGCLELLQFESEHGFQENHGFNVGLMSHTNIVWGSLSIWRSPFKPILVGSSGHIWLVVDLPLWNIWFCQLGWWHFQLNG